MPTAIATKQDILDALHQNRSRLWALGVRSMGVFGSFVRGQQRPESDIDLLVEFEQDKKTFDLFMELSFFLEDLLQHRIELVTTESLSPILRRTSSKRSSMPLSPLEYLRHILDEAEYLLSARGIEQGAVSTEPNAHACLRQERRDYRRSVEESASRIEEPAPRSAMEGHGRHERSAHSRLLRRRLRSDLGRCPKQDTVASRADSCHSSERERTESTMSGLSHREIALAAPRKSGRLTATAEATPPSRPNKPGEPVFARTRRDRPPNPLMGVYRSRSVSNVITATCS